MDKTDISDKVEYVIAAISEFGKRHGLSHVEAYRYLKRFQGMDMLDKFNDLMHTLSLKDVTDDLTTFCHRHGGALKQNCIHRRSLYIRYTYTTWQLTTAEFKSGLHQPITSAIMPF